MVFPGLTDNQHVFEPAKLFFTVRNMRIKVREKVTGGGDWYVYTSDHGNRKAYRIGTKDQAESFAARLREKHAMNEAGIVGSSSDTFAELAMRWLDTCIKPPLKSSTTYRCYTNSLINHVLPAIGRVQIATLTRRSLKDMLMDLQRDGLSPHAISLAAIVTGMVFKYAQEADIALNVDASRLYSSLKIKTQDKPNYTPFTAAEMAEILQWLKENRPGYYLPIAFLFKTGVRIGEMLVIECGDVDIDAGTVMIRRAVSGTGVISEHTKTKQARSVTISALFAEELMSILGSDGEWLFRDRFGGMLTHHKIRVNFDAALAELGLSHRRIHDIRHSYASLILSAGAPMVYVRDQLGHSSIQMTVDRYGKFVPSTGGDYAAIMD